MSKRVDWDKLNREKRGRENSYSRTKPSSIIGSGIEKPGNLPMTNEQQKSEKKESEKQQNHWSISECISHGQTTVAFVASLCLSLFL